MNIGAAPSWYDNLCGRGIVLKPVTRAVSVGTLTGGVSIEFNSGPGTGRLPSSGNAPQRADPANRGYAAYAPCFAVFHNQPVSNLYLER